MIPPPPPREEMSYPNYYTKVNKLIKITAQMIQIWMQIKNTREDPLLK